MVVIHGWKSAPLGRSGLLKSITNLSKKLIAETSIKLDDINIIIHGGVYRRNFRVEPAFATHVQDALGLKCTLMTQDSSHCFSFDVSDGSCSPYVVLDAARNMLRIKPGGYCLITLGDERPNPQSKWPYQPISCVMIASLEGEGPRLVSTSYDLSEFDDDEDDEDEDDDDEDEDEDDEDDEDESEEELEVDELEINGKLYFTTDDKNGILYSVDEDGDIGDEIGYLKNGKAFFS